VSFISGFPPGSEAASRGVKAAIPNWTDRRGEGPKGLLLDLSEFLFPPGSESTQAHRSALGMTSELRKNPRRVQALRRWDRDVI
jgi:hypothetical protein